MLALDMAATLRPLRRTVSALRMRGHPLREDLTFNSRSVVEKGFRSARIRGRPAATVT
ncbi:hypothetical protein STAFG_3215 [Streptomyces afghaniensis 772]|uniref:Uncharacterized protein n=1 Tax=Streptomyces afghaniensis 772 TaxID=1283301 RepID=S4N077_9ACTN|nr:hypothetical protein STAFG_3215 [Streptomyces afghaniensis 772]